MNAIKGILNELEKEIEVKKSIYHSYINQPSLISISSDTSIIKEFNTNNTAFYTFTCNIEKPPINVKSLQLLSANIPQAKGYSFDDTELIFPYYRLKTQLNVAGNTIVEEPSIDNLYYVRLLPSYYPSNIIPNAQNYGFNKTFNNYQELSNELAKACQNDLLYTNINYSKFTPNDVTIRYNETFNKFEMIGNNIYNRIDAGYPPVWDVDATYNTNDIVFYSGSFYISLIDNNINEEPVYLTNWQLYEETPTTIWNTYLVCGYDDPNFYTLQQDINQQINDGNADFFYGQYGLNNIVSIPSQPYKRGKSLAKRIGFTWNGVYNWQQSNTIEPFLYTQGSSMPLLWNRLRPIPPYELIVDVGATPIPNNNPYTQNTYIADDYCNLVYSSIINIYSDITSASSFDTQSKKNILAIAPLNCSQLGISFVNNFIDNPLTKINSDIYQIRIELRNEIDEPYYISNNGIITLMFKLTY